MPVPGSQRPVPSAQRPHASPSLTSACVGTLRRGPVLADPTSVHLYCTCLKGLRLRWYWKTCFTCWLSLSPALTLRVPLGHRFPHLPQDERTSTVSRAHRTSPAGDRHLLPSLFARYQQARISTWKSNPNPTLCFARFLWARGARPGSADTPF